MMQGLDMGLALAFVVFAALALVGIGAGLLAESWPWFADLIGWVVFDTP